MQTAADTGRLRRLLVVTHNYPRFRGDRAGSFVAGIAEGAVRAGWTVRVVAPHAPGTPRSELLGGVEVERFRYAPDALETVAYRGDLHRSATAVPIVALVLPAFLGAFALAVRRQIHTFQPSVIHAHWWFPGGWIAAAVGGRTPLVITCHGSDVRLLERKPFAWLARRVLARAAAVSTVSAFLARDMARLLPGFDRAEVTPMPVDLERFAGGRSVPKAAPPRVLYAGNFVASKGIDRLLRAFALLRQRGVACRLRLLGDGPERNALARLASQLGVGDQIDWGGFTDQSAMAAEFGAAEVTVLPSRGMEEGLGLVLVEALAAGSAVVGTNAGGIPEVVADGETGLIAAGDDPAALADAIERLLRDPALRARTVAEGQRRVESTYATRAALARLFAVYELAAPSRASRVHGVNPL